MKHTSEFLLDISSNHTEYSKDFTSIISGQEALSNTTDNIFFLSGVRSNLTKRASDKDVVSKKYFYIDLDIKKVLSTQPQFKDIYKLPSEVGTQKVIKYANQIKRLLGNTRLSDWRYINFTGNGVHIYYVSETALDVGADITATQYKRWLEMILDEFEGLSEDEFTRALLSPDKACSNIGRIARLPWSFNVKWEAIKTFLLDFQDVYTEKLYWFNDVEVENRATSKVLGVASGSCDISLDRTVEADKFRNYTSYSAMLKYIVPMIELIPLLNDEYTAKPHVTGAGASIHRPRKDSLNSTRTMFISKYNELIRSNSQNEWWRLLKDYPGLQGKDKLTIVDVAMAVTGDRLRDFKSWIGKQGLSHIVESINRFDNNGKLRAEKSPDSNKKKVTGSLVPKENESACNRSKNGKFDTSGNDNKTAIIPWNIHEKTLIHTETKAWLTSLKDKVKQYQKTWGRFQKEIRESCKGLRLYPISNEMINYRFSKAKDIDRYIQTTVAVLEGILTREIEVSHTDITEMTIFNLVKEKYEKKI